MSDQIETASETAPEGEVATTPAAAPVAETVAEQKPKANIRFLRGNTARNPLTS